ncbi:hypothetical protein KEM55_006409, partial [Ascosphaera atra]
KRHDNTVDGEVCAYERSGDTIAERYSATIFPVQQEGCQGIPVTRAELFGEKGVLPGRNPNDVLMLDFGELRRIAGIQIRTGERVSTFGNLVSGERRSVTIFPGIDAYLSRLGMPSLVALASLFSNVFSQEQVPLADGNPTSPDVILPSPAPESYLSQAREILKTTPLIDGHNDLPLLIRILTKNRIYNGTLPFLEGLPGQTDQKRLREGQVGGQFWSVYVDCPRDPDTKIDDPTWSVRDTLEQIDVAKRLIEEYPSDLHYCTTPACAREAFSQGKIGSFLGIEGGHQVGNSLGALRTMYELGARYMTLTHNCDNAFATAASSVAAGGADAGLTEFGGELVREMNRLGMLVDLSHVSHQTMRDVLGITKVPVMFSHSSAYNLSLHLRNVPDDVLRMVRENGGVVMANFVPEFLDKDEPGSATIDTAVEHILHIAEVAGWEHVGVGADFDGALRYPVGLEDVSRYPQLVAKLLERGASEQDVRNFAGENVLRVWAAVEDHARRERAKGVKPSEETWEGRKWEEVDYV